MLLLLRVVVVVGTHCSSDDTRELTHYPYIVVALNELYQYYYQRPPQFKTEMVLDGVQATVMVEGEACVGVGFSKAKATQEAAKVAIKRLREIHGGK